MTCRASRRSPRRHRPRSRGLRRGRPPRSAVERPAVRPQPGAHLRHQPPGVSVRLAAAAKAAGVGRFLFSSSCSLYGTGGDELLDERRRSTPSRPTASRRCASSTRSPFSPTTTSRPCTCATPRRTGSPGACVPTSSSTTSSATPSPPARCCCRATAPRGARSCTSPTSLTPCGVLAAPREVVHNRGVQRRSLGENYRHPRRRRHGRRGRARLHGHDGHRRVGGQPRLPGRLHPDRTSAPRLLTAVDAARRDRGAVRGLRDGVMTAELHRTRLLPSSHDPAAAGRRRARHRPAAGR